jgi:hypothetical protein
MVNGKFSEHNTTKKHKKRFHGISNISTGYSVLSLIFVLISVTPAFLLRHHAQVAHLGHVLHQLLPRAVLLEGLDVAVDAAVVGVVLLARNRQASTGFELKKM